MDTPIYNAHSTASDALWATVPILTLPREKMASRVAASLVMSLGMPELVVRNMAEYIEVAVILGSSPRKSGKVRSKLSAARREGAARGGMFDVGGWMVKYEAGLRIARELAVHGAVARHIVVAGIPGK